MDHHNHEEFEPDPEVVKPQLLPLLTLSNREFKEKFGPIAGSWRGKKPIQRNAVLALGTYKAKEGVKTLIHLLKNDPRPVIRGSSAWSLGQIGTEEAVHALEEANTHETSEKVLEEISKVLDPISVK